MSAPVSPLGLWAQIEAHGTSAQLVTVTAEGRPHVVAVTVAVGETGDRLVVPAGRHSRAHVAAHPHVTLLWPGPAGRDHSLVVDGTAVATDDGLVVRPTSALLHRVAHAPPDVPRCLTVTVPPDD